MRGAVLGMWLTKEYQAEISRLPANYGSMDKREGFYGLVHSEKGVTYGTLHTGTAKSKSYVDGMCGQSSVARIAAAIGVDWFEAKKSR